MPFHDMETEILVSSKKSSGYLYSNECGDSSQQKRGRRTRSNPEASTPSTVVARRKLIFSSQEKYEFEEDGLKLQYLATKDDLGFSEDDNRSGNAQPSELLLLK